MSPCAVYLSLLDWDLRRDDINGYFYAETQMKPTGASCPSARPRFCSPCHCNDESQERLGLEQDALQRARGARKIVTDYAILPAKPNMEEVKRALTVFENHSILQRIEGKFNQADCRFAILPTIQTAVSSERLNEVAAVLRKEGPPMKKLKKILLD